MFDFSHPWYLPLYRRIGVVLVCALWFGMEAWTQNPFWMILAGSATALTVWKLLLTFPKITKD